MTITWSRLLKPSSSTSSWFSVWSCSRLNPCPVRAVPTASSSSMKTIAGAVLACVFEKLADPGGAEAGEHLDERRGALRVEAGAGLMRDGLGEQRLAGARRPVEQDPLRHACAELGEALRVAKEVDDLLHLGSCLFESGDLVPGDGRLGRRVDVLRLDPRHHLEGAPEQVDDEPEHERAGTRSARSGRSGSGCGPRPAFRAANRHPGAEAVVTRTRRRLRRPS